MLKTNNTQRVNSGNRQTPAAKHLLLVACGAQAMLSAISTVSGNGQHLHENIIFHIFLVFSFKWESHGLRARTQKRCNNKRSQIPGYQKHMVKRQILSESVKNTL